MPLIKTGGYEEPELFTYNSRLNWWKNDSFRTLSQGRFVSIRAASMRTSVVIKGLQQMAEPYVMVDDQVLNLYRSAQMAIGHEMSKLFRKVSKIAVHPQKAKCVIPVDWERLAGKWVTVPTEASELIFYPVAADYIGEANVVLFRAALARQLEDDPLKALFTQQNTGIIGLCSDSILAVSKELHDYVSAIEARAVLMNEPTQRLNALNALLRPEETRAREFKDKQAAYGSHFGTWG